MSLSKDISDKLLRPLDMRRVQSREQGGRKVSYLATHDVIRTANAAFGFGEWGHEVVELTCVGQEQVVRERDQKSGYKVGYRCIVRLLVNGCMPTSGVGYGDAQDYSGSAITPHELAAKEAESDAMKRALKNFGDQFGLVLYAKPGAERERVEHEIAVRMKRAGEGAGAPSPADSSADGPEAAVAPAPLSSGAVSQPTDEARASHVEEQSEAGPSADQTSEGEADAPAFSHAARGSAVETPSDDVEATVDRAPPTGGPTTAQRDVPAEPEERTFPGGEFPDHAVGWLIDEMERSRILDVRGIDPQAAFERWDLHRMDGNAAKNIVAACSDPDLLILWADREARTRARKGVLEAIGRRLDKIGGGGGASDVDERHDVNPAPAEPLPETLQAVTPLLRIKAALAYIDENPSSVAAPRAWTTEGVLLGMKQSGMGDHATLEDAPEETLAEVWGFVPQDVRLHIEGLDYDTVVRMGDLL